jgi:hypothetical protein
VAGLVAGAGGGGERYPLCVCQRLCRGVRGLEVCRVSEVLFRNSYYVVLHPTVDHATHPYQRTHAPTHHPAPPPLALPRRPTSAPRMPAPRNLGRRQATGASKTEKLRLAKSGGTPASCAQLTSPPVSAASAGGGPSGWIGCVSPASSEPSEPSLCARGARRGEPGSPCGDRDVVTEMWLLQVWLLQVWCYRCRGEAYLVSEGGSPISRDRITSPAESIECSVGTY